MLNDALRDIVEGDVWYCNYTNLLLLGPNKIGIVLGTRVRGASESACMCIDFMRRGKMVFLTILTVTELSFWMGEGG